MQLRSGPASHYTTYGTHYNYAEIKQFALKGCKSMILNHGSLEIALTVPFKIDLDEDLNCKVCRC